ncbi:hypothetical protein BDN71DRAFT_1002819 [Pleurotus eryngii]|uniref:Uncharacterized protein n=1 Tax=Pleurotus eryngii TaxID=5323 RepID=A0A9P6DFA4_PLEER|nr:hypothetical protein BDN71DRAFT_1002819 [Pleurotus eryngii]
MAARLNPHVGWQVTYCPMSTVKILALVHLLSRRRRDLEHSRRRDGEIAISEYSQLSEVHHIMNVDHNCIRCGAWLLPEKLESRLVVVGGDNGACAGTGIAETYLGISERFKRGSGVGAPHCSKESLARLLLNICSPVSAQTPVPSPPSRIPIESRTPSPLHPPSPISLHFHSAARLGCRSSELATELDSTVAYQMDPVPMCTEYREYQLWVYFGVFQSSMTGTQLVGELVSVCAIAPICSWRSWLLEVNHVVNKLVEQN